MADQTVSIVAILKDQLSGPLKGISRQLSQVAIDARRVGAAIGPLAGQIASALGALAGFAGASAAIKAAEGAAQAERGLLAALGDRIEAMERIRDVAGELAKASTFDDDSIVAAAARLSRMGVSAEKLPIAMRASVEVAAALQIPLEAASTAISQIGAGFLPRELSKAVPMLRDLEKQGRLAGDGIEYLAANFVGAAAALAETPFGRATQLMNELGNQSERIGNVLIKLKVSALDVLLPKVEALAAALESPRAGIIVNVLREMMPLIATISAGIAGISVALGFIGLVAWAGPLFTVLGTLAVSAASAALPIVAIAGAFLAVGVGAVALGRKIPVISTALDGVGRSATGARDQIARIITDVENGTLRISDLLGALALAGDRTMEALGRRWEDFAQGLRFLFTGTAAFDLTKKHQQTIDEFLADARGKNIEAISADAVKQIGIEEEKTQKILADIQRGTATERALASEQTEARVAARRFELDELFRLEEISSREFFDLRKQLEQGALRARLAAVNSEIAAERGVVGPLRDQTSAARETAALLEEGLVLLQDDTVAIADRLAKEREVLAARQHLTDLVAQEGDAQSRLLPLLTQRRDLLDQLALSERQASQERLKLADAEVKQADAVAAAYQEATGAALEAAKAGTISIGEASTRIAGATAELQTRLVGIRQELEALYAGTQGRLGAEQDLDRLRAGLNALGAQLQAAVAPKLIAETTRQAQEIFTGAEEALRLYQEEIQTTSALAEQGFLGQADAQDRTRVSAAHLRSILDETQAGILALAVEAEGAAPELADLFARIQELRDRAFGPELAGGFLWGLQAGIRGVTERYETMRQVGIEVGQALAQGVAQLGADLVGAFTSGEKNLKQFFARFLSSLSQAITQMLILRALMGVLLLGPPAGAAAGSWVVAHTGGLIPRRYAPGGPVLGPDVNQDIVPALLTPGEYVEPRAAVRAYGVQAMEAIRRQLIPPAALRALMPGGLLGITTPRVAAFAAGGTVMPAQSSAAGPTPAFLVADDQAMDRLLAGGRAAMLRFVERESGAISAVLGRGGNRR